MIFIFFLTFDYESVPCRDACSAEDKPSPKKGMPKKRLLKKRLRRSKRTGKYRHLPSFSDQEDQYNNDSDR